MAGVGRARALKLDVGCGSGRSYPFNPAAKGPDVIYLDLEAPSGPVEGRSFIVADAHHLPFRSCAFSEVYMMHVLEHLEEPHKAVREAHRVLAPGGKLVLEVPGMFSRVFELDPSHKWRFSPFGLRELLRCFSKVRIRPEGISPKMVPVGPLRLLLARWLPRVPWFLCEYLTCSCVKSPIEASEPARGALEFP